MEVKGNYPCLLRFEKDGTAELHRVKSLVTWNRAAGTLAPHIHGSGLCLVPCTRLSRLSVVEFLGNSPGSQNALSLNDN